MYIAAFPASQAQTFNHCFFSSFCFTKKFQMAICDDLKPSLVREKNATLPPKRGRIMALILEDLMMDKEKKDHSNTRSNIGKPKNFVPRRGMILEEFVDHHEVMFRPAVSGNSTTGTVPRRGMIKLRILEEFMQMLMLVLPPAPKLSMQLICNRLG